MRRASPLPVRIASAIFAAALRGLPGSHRGAFDGEIREAFHDDASDSYRQRGVLGLARATASALLDVAFDSSPRQPRGGALVSPIVQDLRYGARMVRRQPGFTAAAFAMLALGIGGNAAMFTLVNAALLRPLPYADADRLVRAWGARADTGDARGNVNPNDAADWLRGAPALESLGVASTTAQPMLSLSTSGDPVMVPVAFVSSGYLETLQVSPAMGRLLGAEHDLPGRDTDVVITDGLWRRALGADPHAVGKTIRLADVPCTIVGILPRGFVSPGMRSGAEPQVWRPLVVAPDNRGGHFATAIARLRPGASIAEAQQQVNAVAERLSIEFPSTNFGQRARLEPLHEAIAGDVRPAMLLLMAAVAVVLLIACANVANLLLARAASRRREFALRGALGATRGRLVRQLLVESLMLAVASAAAGLGAGSLLLQALPLWLVDQMPTVMAATLDARVLAFTLLLSFATVIVFGLVPAIVASRHDLRATLAAGAPGGGGGTVGFRSLVVIETALALILLVAAALFVRSLARLQDVDPGFDTAQTLTFRVSLPRTRYPQPQQRNAFLDALIARLSAQPGVVAAGGVNTSPLSGRASCDSFGLGDRPAPPEGQEPCAEVRVATPGYFAAMRIPLVAGRALAESDTASGLRVVVISEAMARRYWPGGGAIGQRMKWGSVGAPTPWLTIVGVIGDVKHFGLVEPAPDEVYTPLAQSSATSFTLAVRTGGNPSALREQARALVREADPLLPVAEVMTTRELVERSIALPAYRTQLLAAFAAFALVLAVAGVYSLTACHVAQRRREIGIRLALGAAPGDVKAMVVSRGLRSVALGCVLGTLATVPLMRFAGGLLFGVTPGDPACYAAAAVILLTTASIASYVPARRATRFDPVETLRAD